MAISIPKTTSKLLLTTDCHSVVNIHRKLSGGESQPLCQSLGSSAPEHGTIDDTGSHGVGAVLCPTRCQLGWGLLRHRNCGLRDCCGFLTSLQSEERSRLRSSYVGRDFSYLCTSVPTSLVEFVSYLNRLRSLIQQLNP